MNEDGTTPGHVASASGNEKAVRLLLSEYTKDQDNLSLMVENLNSGLSPLEEFRRIFEEGIEKKRIRSTSYYALCLMRFHLIS